MISTLLLILFFALPAWAAGPVPSPKTSPAAAFQSKTKLNFEDEVVEGMNRNPFDSVEHVGEEDSEGHHLYRKRQDFKKEMPVLIQEMGYSE